MHSVAIIGAGALGILYASALKALPASDVFFLADDERYDALAAASFTVNGEPSAIPVRSPPSLEGHADLVIVAVKNHHLHSIVPLLTAAAGPESVVLSVLNGIDSEVFIESACPQSTVLYCVALGMDAVRTSTQLEYTNRGRLLIGAKDNNPRSPELLAVAAFLEQASLVCEIPADIHRELWWKLMINIGMNQVSAVTGATYRLFQTNRDTQALMEAAMRETVEVAVAEGVDLREDDITNWYAILNRLGPDGKTSMLQDMEAGRRTETPSFGGRLIMLAALHGIPVPVNETLVRIIMVRESLFVTPRS